MRSRLISDGPHFQPAQFRVCPHVEWHLFASAGGHHSTLRGGEDELVVVRVYLSTLREDHVHRQVRSVPHATRHELAGAVAAKALEDKHIAALGLEA